jgi:hypothetical protein
MSRQRIISKRRSESDTIKKHLSLDSSLDWNVHNIRLSNYSRKLEQTFCAFSCALFLLFLAFFLLSHCFSLLSHCSLCSLCSLTALLALLVASSRACLKRPCFRSHPKTEANDARIGVYIIYIYVSLPWYCGGGRIKARDMIDRGTKEYNQEAV